jgi:hypothetical protein
MNTKYQINNFLKFAEEDNWKEGCDPNTTQSFMVDVSFYGATAEEVIQKAAEYLGVEEDGILRNSCDEKGRVDFQLMEDADSTSPSKQQIKDWKKGNCRLWEVTYTANVEKVTPAKI